jgi:CBS domain-containing protein
MRNLSDVICDQNPLIVPETTTVKSACQRMHERRAGSVLVTDESGTLVGIFTGRDAVCAVLAKGRSASKTPLSAVMTRNPVTMKPNRTALDALRLMWDGGFRHVPLVDGDKIVGCVSRGDFKGHELGAHDDERELWEHMR